MDEKLRSRLLSMAGDDARIRGELAESGELFEGYHPKMEKVHLQNAAQLERIIDEYGWPGRTLVGEDGAEAAWLIAQHAISLPEFSRKCLCELRASVEKGEAEPYQAAYLEDRIRFLEGRPQRYGTQSDWNENGQMQVWTLEDEERVNEYRAQVGLGPLEWLVREAAGLGEQAPGDLARRKAESEEWARKTGWR